MNKYLAIVLPALIAIVSIVWDYLGKSKKSVIILCGLTMVFLIVALYERYQSDSESEMQNKELTTRLNALQNKYDTLHEETLKNVMGYGYSILTLRSGYESNEYIGVLINNNEYPSYNIDLTITPPSFLKGCVKEHHDGIIYLDAICHSSNSRSFSINEIQPKLSVYINDFRINSKDEFVKLEVIYNSRSAHILQQIIIKLGKGICQYSYRIWEYERTKEWNQRGSQKIIEIHNGITGFIPEWDREFPVPVPNRILRTY